MTTTNESVLISLALELPKLTTREIARRYRAATGEGLHPSAAHRRALAIRRERGLAAAPAPPCGDCGTTGGAVRAGTSTPIRRPGTHWGFRADLCWRCFARHYVPSGRAHGTPPPPCASCGTPAGFRRHGRRRPNRFDGRPYGFDGEICDACYQRSRRRSDAPAPRRRGNPTPAEIEAAAAEIRRQWIATTP